METSSVYRSQPAIMVVEDQALVALDLKSELQALGYAVLPLTGSGEEAVRRAGDAQPDLILMDIRLAGEMDGITAGSIIRSRMDVPIVFLTAHADDETISRAKASEPFGYILKPFDSAELKTAIEMALYKHSIEVKLKERERWVATTLRSIGDGVLATDSRGRVKFINPVAEALTGWELVDAAGKKASLIFRACGRKTPDNVADCIAETIQRGIPVNLPEDARLTSRLGRDIDISGSISPICGNAGHVLGAVVVFRDVSEHEALLGELQRHRDHLEELVRERTRELDVKRTELGAKETELRKGLRDLEEHRIALKVLIERNEEYHLSLGRALVTNLKTRVAPRIDSLKQSRLSADQQAVIDLIENDIAEITSPFTRNLSGKNFRLTFLETQIAVLIKQGKNTKEIAAILRSSPRTIEFHRQNLRKKIGLTGKDVSLESRLAEFS